MADPSAFDPHAFDVNYKMTPSPVQGQADIFGNLNAGYAGAIAGQEKAPALISRYNDQFGIPQMQSNIAAGTQQYDYLGNQIASMPKDIAARSQESILTNAQKGRQVQAESAPLLAAQGLLGQNLSRQQTNLGVAQTNAAQMVSATQVDQEKQLLPWLKQYDTESILSSMKMTGWSFENEKELSRLFANQSAGIQLSEGEKNRIQELSMQEKSFKNAIELQGMQDKSALARFSPYSTKSAGQTIYNTQTGGQKGYQIVSP